jgi:hypothetical protein
MQLSITDHYPCCCAAAGPTAPECCSGQGSEAESADKAAAARWHPQEAAADAAVHGEDETVAIKVFPAGGLGENTVQGHVVCEAYKLRCRVASVWSMHMVRVEQSLSMQKWHMMGDDCSTDACIQAVSVYT